MATPPRSLQSRFDSVVAQLPLKIEQVSNRIGIIGIDRHPFTGLRRRVDRVQTDGNFAEQVSSDGLPGERQIILRPIVVTAACTLSSCHCLDGVSPAVYEKIEIPFHKAARGSEFYWHRRDLGFYVGIRIWSNFLLSSALSYAAAVISKDP